MWNLSHELEISSIRWVTLWYFSVTLKSHMEATKYYLLDFARKEAGVSSFLVLRPKYGRLSFWAKSTILSSLGLFFVQISGREGGGVTISLSENFGRFNSIDILNVSNEKLCRSYSQLNVLIDLKNCSPTSKESWMKRDVTYLDLTSKQEWRHSENQMMGGNRLNSCNLPLEAK